MKLNTHFLCLFAAFAFGIPLHATHNYAGEIIFRKTGPLTVEAQIVTYTRIQSVAADRDTLTICWGDGTCEQLVRANGGGEGEPITAQIKKNIYTGTHTYASAQAYTISMTDPNRSAGIINVNPPQSENVPFHLESTISFLPGAAGSLNSPVLLEAPVDIAYTGQPFVHVPGAYDLDGDSLAYELVTPMQAAGIPVPNYSFPNQIAPGPNNQISLSQLSGKMTWNTPQIPGIYVLAILIKAYRNGQPVETIQRDMIIEVTDKPNLSPVIVLDVPEEQILDVSAGDTVTVLVQTSDPDAGQIVTLSSVSGLYTFYQSPAVFMNLGTDGLFRWVVRPEYVREQPHAVVFKATDDAGGFVAGGTPEQDPGQGLAVYKVVLFRVRATVAAGEPDDRKETLAVYPNPVSQVATVDWGVPLPAGAQLQLTDMFGRPLRMLDVSPGATRTTVVTADLPAGQYMVRLLSAENKTTAARLLKN